MTTNRNALVSTTGLIRWSAIRAHLIANGDRELAEMSKIEMEAAGHTCDTHGHLEDPLVMVDPNKGQMIVACPWCSSPELLARWEVQGR